MYDHSTVWFGWEYGKNLEMQAGKECVNFTAEHEIFQEVIYGYDYHEWQFRLL